MIELIKSLFSTVLGLLLSLCFVAIPTLLFNPSRSIFSIQSDICLDIPHKYTVVNKYEDWLGFEQHQEVVFKFTEEQMKTILNQIESKICAKGKWIKANGTFQFNIDQKISAAGHYIVGATLSEADKTLTYKYSGF